MRGCGTAALRATACAAVLGVLLTGCTPATVASTSTPTPSPSTSPSATPTPTAAPALFSMPLSCDALLPTARLSAFADQELTLLGGPGGKYGDSYFADPTPERLAGGITCIWGDTSTDIGNLTISVAPLDPSTRPGVVSGLEAQGLNESTEDGANLFWRHGDEANVPAILNVLRQESWISVIAYPGGEARYQEALQLADEVAGTVYVAG